MSKSLESKFSENFSQLLEKEKISDSLFAIGVSGGADSLTLVFLMQAYVKQFGGKIVALTVNHGLRVDSLEEAIYVTKLMKANQIEHHILTWQGEKPKTGIEEAARKTRYALMNDFCVKHKISNLLVAHHKIDQAETFLIRLQRGSGVDGLSGMSEVNKLGEVTLIRPLLTFMPQDLKTYLKSKKINWKEDSLNSCDDFLRVKIRKFLPELEERIGLTVERLTKTTQVMARTRDYLEKQTENFIKNNVKFYHQKVSKISLKILQAQHDEILFRVLAKLLKETAEREYIPRAGHIERICLALRQKGYKSRTLGGCAVVFQGGDLWIFPELKNSKTILKKDLEKFMEENFKNEKMPHPVKKYLFMQALEF
ncbi:MAG: tRNA lysidine(34) synthetase TilS [Alphaproteobacteria bacterium]|nr:tRNA lysidine(34) synthetase TilS [Alphaproteobacteria bacterium]